MSTARGYNALTGAELKKVILAEVERSLDNADICSAGTTFPTVEWCWSLSLYQKTGEIPERTVTAGTHKPNDRLDAALKMAHQLSSDPKRFKHSPPSPTEVREAHGLPIPEA